MARIGAVLAAMAIFALFLVPLGFNLSMLGFLLVLLLAFDREYLPLKIVLAFAASFGLDPAAGREGLSLAQVVETVHPDDRAGLREAMGRVIARGGPYAHQYRTRRADGRYYWLEANGRVDLAPDGTPVRFPGVLIDVEERRAGEAERERVTEQLRSLNETLEQRVAERTAELRLSRDILQSSTTPICAFDTEYRLIAFNRAHSDEFHRIFGHRVRLGEVFPDLFPLDQAPVMRSFMTRALRGEVFTVTEAFGDPDLAKPSWEVSYSSLRDEDGRIIGAFVMLYGVAFVTIFVAAITSIFVTRASQDRGLAEDQAEQRIELRLDVIDDRLVRLEDMLRKLTAA